MGFHGLPEVHGEAVQAVQPVRVLHQHPGESCGDGLPLCGKVGRLLLGLDRSARRAEYPTKTLQLPPGPAPRFVSAGERRAIDIMFIRTHFTPSFWSRKYDLRRGRIRMGPSPRELPQAVASPALFRHCDEPP